MFDLPKTFGRYRLVEFLGQGAMAEVYRATVAGPLGFSKCFAVKVIPPSLAGDGTLVAAMVNEARLGSLLHHPNVVEIVDFNRHDGYFYLAMEYIEGVSLDDLLGHYRRRRRFLPPAAVLEIGRQACAGLAHAHAARDREGRPLGLVHRDLKPHNLRLSTDGVLKVLDFGIARAEGRIGTSTAVGVTKGTPLYMSPEQVNGGDLSPASDIFSLGAVLYEAATLKQLFGGDNLAHILNQVLRADVEEAAEEADVRVPGLGDVLARATARRPHERYPDAARMEEDLRALLLRHSAHGAYDLRPLAEEARGALEEARRSGAANTEVLDVPGLRSGGYPALSGERGRRLGAILAAAAIGTGAGVGAWAAWFREGPAPPQAPPATAQLPGPDVGAAARVAGLAPQVAGDGVGAEPIAPSEAPPASDPPGAAASAPVPRPGAPRPAGEAAGVPAGRPAPAPARLRIDSDVFMYVRIDGRPAEEGPLLDRPVEPGRHVLVYESPKYPGDRRSEVIDLQPGQVFERWLEFRPSVEARGEGTGGT